MPETVVTRFAPSPTGHLHVGGVRTALFNWLYARQHGGKFILRIDDTDATRNQPGAVQTIIDGLKWLGLDWDEGPYFQSERKKLYQNSVNTLLDAEAAYWDCAEPSWIEARRKTGAYAYRGDFEIPRNGIQGTYMDGRKLAVRMRVLVGDLVFSDLVKGNMEFKLEAESDPIIRRADGTFTYHLASASDDIDMKVTHVIRSDEHLSNTPKHVLLDLSLLGEGRFYAHLPCVCEPGSKSKLSKRKLDKYATSPHFKCLKDRWDGEGEFNPVSIDFYRRAGFSPDVLLNYLLLLGWSLDDRTEEFTREEMIEKFSLERVKKSPASFDPKKLIAFQRRFDRKGKGVVCNAG